MRPRPAWMRALPPAAVAAAVLLAFSPALSAGFLDWDDDRNFVQNEAYRGLSPAHLRWMATTFHLGPYQPLSWLTLSVDHALWGMDARGYHLTNVLLHAATAVAFLFLARTLMDLARPEEAGSHDLPALLAALLFAVHPLRVESVAWVTERRDVLSGLFYVLCVHAWLRGRRGWSLSLFALGLLSKASGLTLPFVLLLLDAWPLRRFDLRRSLLDKLPFLALSLVFGTLALHGQSLQRTALRTLEEHGVIERLAQAGYGAAFYPWRTLLPFDLVPIHDLPREIDPLAPRFLVPGLAAAITTAALYLLRRRASAAWTAWAAFLVLLAPSSGLAQAGPQLVADRYGYLACMPFAPLAAAWLARRPPRAALAAPVLVLGLLTWRQATYWTDAERLWTRAVERAPESPVACDHLGNLRLRRALAEPDPARKAALLREADALFATAHAAESHPRHLAHRAAALRLLSAAGPARAPELLAQALALADRARDGARGAFDEPPEWRVTRGEILLDLGRPAEAVPDLESGAAALPREVHPLRVLAVALFRLGRPAQARPHLERAVLLAPRDAKLWLGLAHARAACGERDGALDAFRRVRALKEAELGPAAADDPSWKEAGAALGIAGR